MTNLDAQDLRSWEEYFSQMGQLEDVESERWEQEHDELEELYNNKLDLNLCSREDLRRLPFLSEQQIMDLMEYRDRAHRIETPIELRLIPSLERRDADMLLQFAEIRPELRRDSIPSLSNMLRHGRHELTGALKIPFYSRRGDRDGYLGYKYKHWLRYTFTSGQHLKAGFVASQDAGEPFFTGPNRMGYDFYSYYIILRNLGCIKTLAIGRYRLRFGMGLILNNSFGLGKLHTLSTLGRSCNPVYAHSSRSEGNYLQGAATTVTIARGWDATAFVSVRKIDATLNQDSSTVATLLQSGYHRTASEMQCRHNTSQWLAGGNLNYSDRRFHIGLTGLYTAFSRELRPTTSPAFRRWYPAGSRFWNVSIDYGYVSHRLNIAGETATGTRGTVATINSMSYRIAPNFSLMALHRYYPYQYCAVFANTFAEGSEANNESGLYFGGHWVPQRGMTVMFYADMAYFAWPKYLASASSHSFDNLLQATYERGRWDFLVRYRLKLRERDNSNKTTLIYKHEHRGRMTMGYDGGLWNTRTQADLSYSSFANNSFGYMITENFSYHRHWLRLQATLGYFSTDDYDSRVYAYEPGILYHFSFPSFFGKGVRCAVSTRADLSRHTMIMLKLGITRYFNQEAIGSGLQEIKGQIQCDLEVQMRLRL
ncbi:MAG: helix-hairpin-helix domain-containing protein [Prevotella sp.]|nr:helix-hairpin-helix domain-containing protein [Prevotella sp.]